MRATVEAFIISWNEEKLIPHTLNYYSSFCNKITLLDNHSTDRTVAIAKEMLPEIDVVYWDTGCQYREDLLLNVKNNCWKQSKADYVIVCDTDEFLFADDMAGQIDRMLDKKVILPVVSGYNMGSADFPGDYTRPIYKQVAYGIRDRKFDKQIIFNPRELAEINYGPGSHSCDPVFKREKLLDQIVDFKLLHFKYLSKQYLYEKHGSYATRMSDYSMNNGYGAEYMEGREYIDECFKHIDRYLYKVV